MLEIVSTVLFGFACPLTVGAETAIPPVFGVQHSAFARTPSGTFVVAMVDLDAPTPQNPNVSQIRHFLGDNFTLEPPNRDGLSLLSNSTPALSGFLQPTPPAGSDPHRCVDAIPLSQSSNCVRPALMLI